MENIDRERLYTDYKYRFTYVTKFIEFGQDDIDAIKAVSDGLLPLVPSVVDAVYVKLFSFDITKAVMAKRHEGFEGKVMTDLNNLQLDSEQIKYRKDMLSKYLNRLLTNPYDAKMIHYLDWVAKIHTDTVTKKSKINVEYIHINALLGYVESILLGGIRSLDLAKETETAALIAVNKLIFIQNDFFLKYYSKDGAEFLPNVSDTRKPPKELVKGNDDRVFSMINFGAGLCAGVAAYFGMKAMGL